MKIINQTKNNSCVACVLAMMVGESEKYVLDWFEYTEPPFNDEDALIFLAHHGIYLSMCGVLKVDGKGVDISEYQDIQLTINMESHRAYLIVESETQGVHAHAVFWDGKNVLDPQKKKPQPLKKYKVRYIYPMMATKPRTPIRQWQSVL